MSTDKATRRWRDGHRMRIGARLMARLCSGRFNGSLPMAKRGAFWRRAWDRAYEMGKAA